MSPRSSFFSWMALAGALFSTGCASGDPSGEASHTSSACQPSASRSCRGPDACVGVQTCLDNGSGWGECSCPQPDGLCGNGQLDPSETCDIALEPGPGACPTSCKDGQACTTDSLVGAGTCLAICESTPVASCGLADACCPSGCAPADDADCSASCGNGAVDPGETCDKAIDSGPGACPSSCSDGQACTTDSLVGSVDGCSASCSHSPISACGADDSCCPAGCTTANDPDCSPGCGNGVVDPNETCDKAITTGGGSCPSTCDDGQACTADTLLGSASNCSASCSFTPITECTSNDGCCPPGCSSHSDSDCSATCGNGVLEDGETCDKGIAIGNGACPGSCDDGQACTSDTLVGSADACSASCSYAPITQCQGGDGCCPAGCDAVTDNDCSPTCGNGVVESGETCDKGIASGTGACASICGDGQTCTMDTLVGSASTCSASCSYSPISQCGPSDGCCPGGCNAVTDPDCSASCGNGVVETGETCDKGIANGPGACPTQCDDGQACTTNTLVGSASTCSASCSHTPITQCGINEGCCPAGCDANTDQDCSPTCGNGVLESGETCDKAISGGSGACPASCNDYLSCTVDTLVGSTANCSAACSHTTITQCASGDGCCASGCSYPTDTDCTCVPVTCAYKQCGTVSNGCGGTLSCTCGTGENCDNGTCTCDATHHACAGSCVSNDAIATCGTSCTPCYDDPHGTPTCDGATCGVVCDTGYHQCSATTCCAWTTERVEWQPTYWDFGESLSIAVDSSGAPHIAFSDGTEDAYYATRTGSTWTFETIRQEGSKDGQGISLALAGTTPHVVFRSFSTQVGGNDYLVYGTKTGSNWAFENIEYLPSDPYFREPFSIALGGGSTWAGYTASGGSDPVRVKVAHRSGGSWVVETVHSFNPYSSGRFYSMALGGNGQPHVMAADAATSWYAIRSTSGVWNEAEVPRAGDLVLDGADTPHVCYRTGTALKYAWCDASNVWHEESVDGNVGLYKIALDGSGRPVIAYSNADDYRALYFATRKSAGLWHTERAETGGPGNLEPYALSLAMSGDTPHIAYRDPYTQLRYATVK